MASPRPVWHSLHHGRRRLLAQTAPRAPAARRLLSSSSASPEATAPAPPPPPKPTGKLPLTPEQQALLSAALRVNQAGELAATLIYTAQTPAVVAREPHLRPLMRHMHDQEAAHLQTFNALLARHRVRPTALYPVWSALATGLGWTTGVLGREAAMACTEAVETEIGGHYNGQIRQLLAMVGEWEAGGHEVGGEFRALIGTLRRIRDEELEHLDHAVQHDAHKAQPHWLLTGVIRAGCRGAIWVSERV
ncbi:COQ7-domain-containing protein [Trichocladium antarcticum]|uniref:5-demethoxyubiquinone hydroxylase, mitochondrial n=1 Tax=Trichocladium antarcticum TaxID=1450529 RepID=A0AAN6ZD27_9PEZI|nr:COQ7-domain-containing protein [Trichocladium antarcticum]